MIMQLILRFLAGGVIVSLFAMLGGALKPKTFGGLLGAAPSVALATLTLTVLRKGKPYAAAEAQTMILGAIAFLFYAWLVSMLLMRKEYPVLRTSVVLLIVWLICALGLKFVILG